ncbi:nuclear transport factor 2 family protein [Flaviramulus aquimarinus]|uniref:Nuclear transport factor 2 family protein n=2 Tax=Flaviramulus aquimarinus TaxID=1170456 RepID=A0ABP9EPB3_9FLAO
MSVQFKIMKTNKPPFTKETAKAKVQAAEDAWNSKNPESVSIAYTLDSKWRNRNDFFTGRKAIVEFLTKKWNKESKYKLEKHLWSFTDNRISVRFEYEWQDAETGQWKRTYGNEHWEFDPEGLMKVRDMSANDINILETERKFK